MFDSRFDEKHLEQKDILYNYKLPWNENRQTFEKRLKRDFPSFDDKIMKTGIHGTYFIVDVALQNLSSKGIKDFSMYEGKGGLYRLLEDSGELFEFIDFMLKNAQETDVFNIDNELRKTD